MIWEWNYNQEDTEMTDRCVVSFELETIDKVRYLHDL